MNKNIILVGAIAAGLYLLSQGKKTVKAVAKKKAPQRPPHKYYKSKIKRVIAKKKAIYNKPKIKKTIAKKKAPQRPLHKYYKSKIKRVIAKKKAIYNKPKIKKATTRKKSTYYSPKSRIAIARKQQIKRTQWRKRRR